MPRGHYTVMRVGRVSGAILGFALLAILATISWARLPETPQEVSRERAEVSRERAEVSRERAEAPREQSGHILFIIADDLNTRIGPMVGPDLDVSTPNLDRIAREGVLFTAAYAQYPVCGPSRASILSGLYPETSGATSNDFVTANHRVANPSLADHPSLPGFLRERGYYTARVSKIYHVGVPGGIERGESGSDDPEAWDFAVDIMAPETMSAGHLETLSRGDHYGSNFSRMVLADGADATQADVLAADQAIAIMETRVLPGPPGATNRTRLKGDAPFFLAVGFVRPHVPLIAPERHFASYPDSLVSLVPVPSGDLDDVPSQAARLSNARRFQMNDEEQRKAVAAYHASISFMDEQVGRLLDALERLGIRDQTTIVFLSDHGFNLGEHTSWQKLSLWEESVRVPLMFSGPGIAEGGKNDAVVELIDLYPTIADLAGLGDQLPDRVQGQSLAPALRNPDAAVGDGLAYTITSGKGASLRTLEWRYNRWGEQVRTDNEELYDHVRDPGEFNNLARDPAYQTALDSVRSLFENRRAAARSARP